MSEDLLLRVALCQICLYPHLSEAVIINEIRSVSVDQSVEGKTILPAVEQNRLAEGQTDIFEHVEF